MPTANLNISQHTINDSLDSIVIVNALADLPGGRTLDVSSLPAGTTTLRAGHVIIQRTDDGTLLPLPTTTDGTAYASLPSGHTYIGILKASILTTDPRAAILTAGQVNAAASPYPITSTIAKALPRIEFLHA